MEDQPPFLEAIFFGSWLADAMAEQAGVCHPDVVVADCLLRSAASGVEAHRIPLVMLMHTAYRFMPAWRQSPGRRWDGRVTRSRLPVLIVLLAIGYGTAGYWLVEGKSLLDAFYATVLTLSTLGIGAGPPPGPGGKVFTVSLILFGVVALFTAIGVGTEVVASGELGRWLRMNQATRSIGHLSGHYVICAYGRVGRAVMEELRRRNYTSVVIESKPELEPLLAEHGVRYLRPLALAYRCGSSPNSPSSRAASRGPRPGWLR
jgi:Ion channel/TrkA-N domain